MSVVSVDETTEQTALITEEKVETGTVSVITKRTCMIPYFHSHIPIPQVKFSVLVAYCRACSFILSFLTVLFFILSQASQVATNFWLSEWSNAEDRYQRDHNGTLNPKTACDNANGTDV